MKQPKLTEIDLDADNYEGLIIIGDSYLAEIQFSTDKEPFYVFGTFSQRWYGYNFDCGWGVSGIGFPTDRREDKWKRLWKFEMS